MSRKIGPIRQLSLQCEAKRAVLKKQYSEEGPLKEDQGPIRVSLSAKNPRPPPVKVAWGESEEDGMSKDSILCPRPDLAARLRLAWQAKEKARPNLDIFLSFEQDEPPPGPEESGDTKYYCQRDPDLKSIFRKQIRNNVPSAEYLPTRTDDPGHPARTSPVVVVPIIERPASSRPQIRNHVPPAEYQPTRTDDLGHVTRVSPTGVVPSLSRPQTAAAKREVFQKRANSAFCGPAKPEVTRPPLLRASSVPGKPDAKSKFLATKRKKKVRKDKPTVEDEEKRACDVVTMVSLVSPAGSDNEEEEVSPEQATKTKEAEQTKTGGLRKTTKSVTFQPTSVHNLKTFSSTFASRRGSSATALLLGNAAKKLNTHVQKTNEKRAPSDDAHVDPKRRLIRSASATCETNTTKEPVENEASLPEETATQTVVEPPVVVVADGEVRDDPKEKECWDMYVKMNKKGLTVSFDTILRGMLTPTEYRLRRKLIEQRKRTESLIEEQGEVQ